jgi:hypothetical protein
VQAILMSGVCLMLALPGTLKLSARKLGARKVCAAEIGTSKLRRLQVCARSHCVAQWLLRRAQLCIPRSTPQKNRTSTCGNSTPAALGAQSVDCAPD